MEVTEYRFWKRSSVLTLLIISGWSLSAVCHVPIRLKVEHSGFNPISSQRFGAQFIGRVANPDDMLLFFKRRKAASSPSSAAAMKNLPELELEDTHTNAGVKVQDLV